MDSNKVIFFTLSAAGVYRNLFFFPGSVFDQLKNLVETRKDIKVVLLIHDIYDKFAGNFSSITSDNFKIEIVKIPIN